jgi:hypothetical protein
MEWQRQRSWPAQSGVGGLHQNGEKTEEKRRLTRGKKDRQQKKNSMAKQGLTGNRYRPKIEWSKIREWLQKSPE